MKEKKNLKELINFKEIKNLMQIKNLKENKKLLIIVSVVAVVVIALIVAIICASVGSNDEAKVSDSAVSQSGETISDESAENGEKADDAKADTKSEDKSEGKADAAKEEAKTEEKAPENTKYSEEDVYETDDGVLAAKTESGTEVELTGESLQKIFAEYEKEKGSGSDREKELLDQLQLILETQGAVQ